MVVETPIQKGATMNNTMRYEMYKYIKPQDFEEAPQFVECKNWDFSPFQCPHMTLQGFSDQKKLTPHSQYIVV